MHMHASFPPFPFIYPLFILLSKKVEAQEDPKRKRVREKKKNKAVLVISEKPPNSDSLSRVREARWNDV